MITPGRKRKGGSYGERRRILLQDVTEKIKKRIEKIDQTLLTGQKEIENMHDYYWENYTEMDQYGYEDYDNQQALLSQVNANQEAAKQKQRFLKMLDSPYFGRVDFVYSGETEKEPFYIGIGNLQRRREVSPSSMTGGPLWQVFSMIMTKERLLMKLLPEL